MLSASTQDMQLQAGLTTGKANIQIRDYRGVAPKGYLWYPRNYFEVTRAGKVFTDDTCTTPFVLIADSSATPDTPALNQLTTLDAILAAFEGGNYPEDSLPTAYGVARNRMVESSFALRAYGG